MSNFEVFFYFLCFGIIAGASFAMMWGNIQCGTNVLISGPDLEDSTVKVLVVMN